MNAFKKKIEDVESEQSENICKELEGALYHFVTIVKLLLNVTGNKFANYVLFL